MALILVIDDDDAIRSMLSIFFQKQGYEVEIASNGKEGLSIFKTKPVDLVITDIVMPEKEGIETIGELIHECPDVKIIAISGGCRIIPDTYLSLAKSLGAAYTFNKPVAMKELLTAVKKCLEEN